MSSESAPNEPMADVPAVEAMATSSMPEAAAPPLPSAPDPILAQMIELSEPGATQAADENDG